MNSHVLTKKIIHQEPLYMGFLSPDAGPQWIPPTEYGDDAQEEGRDLGGHPEGGRAGRDSRNLRFWRLCFFVSPKKKASRTWVDEDFCLLKKFSENHSATVWCLIFSGCPSWRGFGCLGLQKSGFCKIWMCNSELGATNSMDTSVSSWLQLMNVAT